jgi:hypothetical protein
MGPTKPNPSIAAPRRQQHPMPVRGFSFLVPPAEIAPDGTQLAHELLDDTGSPPGAGTLFGLLTVGKRAVYFVDDGSNTLNLLR